MLLGTGGSSDHLPVTLCRPKRHATKRPAPLVPGLIALSRPTTWASSSETGNNLSRIGHPYATGIFRACGKWWQVVAERAADRPATVNFQVFPLVRA